MATVTRKGHGLGAIPSKPDPKELGFPSHLVQRMGEFPVRACVGGTLRPTRNDQTTVGCCTGEGSGNMGNRLYRAFGPYLPTPVAVADVPNFDPLFTYALERQAEGTFDQGDVGAQVVTSLQVPGKFGWCPETRPFDPANLQVVPTPEQLAAALKWPGGAYHSIGNNIANIKSCILAKTGTPIDGYTGVIGISVYDSFEDDAVAANGLIPYPNLEVEQLQGGHEEHSLLAYDDTIQCPNSPHPGAVLTENSWGDQWGCECPFPSLATGRGFNWISYDYLMNPNLASDVRMGHLGKGWGGSPVSLL